MKTDERRDRTNMFHTVFCEQTHGVRNKQTIPTNRSPLAFEEGLSNLNHCTFSRTSHLVTVITIVVDFKISFNPQVEYGLYGGIHIDVTISSSSHTARFFNTVFVLITALYYESLAFTGTLPCPNDMLSSVE